MEALTKRGLQYLILEIATTYPARFNKFSFLGKPSSPGDIERKLGRDLTIIERNMAARAFNDLVARELLQSDYSDMVSPENWVTLTDLGRRALQRRALDSLDEALQVISPKLVELRDGMFEALASNRTNGLQQAAHSARELIDQTLTTGAPEIPEDAENKRREKAKVIFKKKAVTYSKSDFDLVDAEINCLLKGQNRLLASAHTRGELERQKVEDLVLGTEIALRRLLLP